MNTRYLESLLAIADQGSIAGAARSLGLTPPTVAEHIAALEKMLAERLVIRRGRRSILTQAGHSILDSSAAIIEQVRELYQQVHSNTPRGTLRVGSISTALTTFMPEVLQTMAQEYPAIEITLEPATTQDLFTKLERGEIDCAITIYPSFALPKRFTWELLEKQSLVLFAHQRFTAPDIRTLLTQAPFIRMERSSWTGQLVSECLKDLNVEPRQLLEMSAQSTIEHLVARGMGVSLLPETGQPMPDEVIRWPIQEGRYSRELGLMGRGGARHALISALGKIARDVCAARKAQNP